MRMKNVAVFASGNGSNFQSLVDAEKAGKIEGHISLLISDKPAAYVNTRAKNEQVPVFAFEAKKYSSKEDYESVLVDILKEMNIDLVVLAGYMRIVGPTLLAAYANKIINLHPSLLPAFPGKDAIGQAIDYGVKVTGATVHFVDEGMDTGPIIQQKTVSIAQEDTNDTLAEKIHKLEHELLVETVNLILKGQVNVRGRKVLFQKSDFRGQIRRNR